MSSLKSKPSTLLHPTPSPLAPTSVVSLSPTPHLLFITPTLIPPQSFTGADANQDIPADLKIAGEQKTTLRRLAPLTLPFGGIDFDYGNDQFLVHLSDPKEENRAKFNTWRQQNYPALVDSDFILN